MRIRYAAAFILLLTLTAYSGATSLKIVEPYNATVYNNGSIYLGKVGPGQPFYVTAASAAANRSGTIIIRGWNQLYAMDLPQGWVVSNSSLYSQYLSVQITPSPNATTGTYTFKLKAENFGNYSKLGNLTLTAIINVTPNVFTLNVSPTTIDVGPGEPAIVYVTIDNTGVSDSPFYIAASGLPAFGSKDQVIALHQTSKQFAYPIYEYEPGSYSTRINVSSVASPLIHEESNVTLTIQASVPNDYSAIGYGSVAFPIIYEPAYDVMYLLKLAISHA